MAELTWNAVRQQAVQAFNGELPHAQTEQEIMDAFAENPQAVLRSLADVTEAVTAGKARSGWAVWKSRCYGVHGTIDTTVTVEDSRERKTRAAEAWIRNAGCYVDRETEITDVDYGPVFGAGGYLHQWRTDELLRERMAKLWREQRPRGERLETEAEAYMAKVKADHQRIKSKEAQ